MSDHDPKAWPGNVKQIGVGDLRRLGIDGENQLYWDGQRVEIRRPLVLTGFQKAVTSVVSLFAILGGLGGFATGINSAAVFLCARDVQWLGCPAQPPPAPSTPREPGARSPGVPS